MNKYDFRKWVRVTKDVCEYLDVNESNQKFWLKLEYCNELEIGHYAWQQGHYPHQFYTNSGRSIEMSYITHIMYLTQPELPNE